MKNNRKINNELSDAELRNYFKGFCSEEDMDQTIADARKAFSYINKQREFRK
jgi:hypothetical protein